VEANAAHIASEFIAMTRPKHSGGQHKHRNKAAAWIERQALSAIAFLNSRRVATSAEAAVNVSPATKRQAVDA
jgi:hypothetical protein